MKKNISKHTIAATLLLSLASCRKEIKFDLNSTEEKIVIEAEIAKEKDSNFITITKTVNLGNASQFPGVTGAKVVISDKNGYAEKLTEEVPGKYKLSSFPGHPGQTYYLSVYYKDREYTASSTMPGKVNLDTVIVSRLTVGQTQATVFLPVYRDPAGVNNYYRFVLYRNNERIKGASLLTDEFNNGSTNKQPVYNINTLFSAGDKIRFEMQCINKETYSYFFSKAQSANLESAAPANPVSNIKGGALGYFNVHTLQYKVIDVK